MSVIRSLPKMVFVLVLVGIVGYCVATSSGWLLLVAGSFAAVSWYVTEGPRGRVLPRMVAGLLLVAVAVLVIADFVQNSGDVAGVLGRFALGLTIIKLYERRSVRDHAHLMSLSLLLMLVGCLRTQGLVFGLLLTIYAVLGVYVLLLFQLYASHAEMTEARRDSLAVVGPGPPPSPTIGRRMPLQFRLLATAIVVCGMVMSTTLFVIFPRNVGRGIVDVDAARTSARTTGFSDEVDLEAGTRITASNRVVGEVEVLSEPGSTFRRGGALLLRGAVLDWYDRGAWRAARGRETIVATTPGRPVALADDASPTTGAVVLSFRFVEGTRTVFSLYVPTSVETSSNGRIAFEPATQTLRSAGGRRLWAYTVRARTNPPDALVAALAADGSTEPAGDFWSTPASDPGVARVAALATRLLADAGLGPRPADGPERWRYNDDAAVILADFLRKGPFEYSLDVSAVVRGNADPVVEFLFETRTGHCEFYASSLAALCRSVGVEARVVTGYLARAYDERSSRYPLLASSAHAWVEVRTGPTRYRPIDPTPPAALPPVGPMEPALAARIRGWLQRLDGAWTRGIVQFDDQTQTRLFQDFYDDASHRIGAMLEATASWMARVNRAFRLGPAGYIWLGIVGAVVVIAVIALVTIVRRRRHVRRTLRVRRLDAGEARRLVKQLGFYTDMLAVLGQAGCGKPSWQPPLAFARSITATRPAAGEIVRRITTLFYDARYARRSLTAEELARARSLVRELAAALREVR